MATRQSSISSLAPSDENGVSWLDLLPKRSLFSYLREKGGGDQSGGECRGNIMCTIKENLFVWSQSESECTVLTVNLKRLCANPHEDIFQILVCTLPDFPEALLDLIPEASGRYIALHCRRGLVVLKLHYHRGEHGEFGGGAKSVLCKTLAVSPGIFIINDHLTLIQVSWHPKSPDTVALLTSDNFIRLFNLAEPDLPLLELPLLSPSSIHLYPNTIKLEEYGIMAFALWNSSAFVFHESGDVSLVSMTQHSRPQKLSMHPQDTTGNYISSACCMLLLETSPLAVVLAGRSGMEDIMMCHCVYLEDHYGLDMQGGSPGPRDVQRLYVVESLNIQCRESERGNRDSERADGELERAESDFTLLRDPANPHGYFVKHPEGVHAVHMPWLGKMETFAATEMSTLISEAQCQANYLISTVPNFTSLQGISIMWEPRLGYALIGLTLSDMECLTLALTEQEDESHGNFVDWVPQRRQVSTPATSNFVKAIQDILPTADQTPLKLYHQSSKAGQENQADCLQFLMKSIKQLRMTYIIRQQLALKKTEERVESSCRLKEKIISDLATLRDDCDVIEEESERLQDRLKRLTAKNTQLLQHLKRFACRAESRPPVLSEAEECMMKEMEGLSNHMKIMHSQILNNVGKLRLCREMNATPEVDLSATQSSSLLKKLVDNGEKIKALASLVKALCEVTTSGLY